MGAATACVQVQPAPGAALAASLGRQAFRSLERWLYSAPSRSMGLPGVELETERRGRELLRLLLQAHIDGHGNGDLGPALRVSTPDGLLLYSHKRLHTRRLITLFGTVSITRMGYGRRGETSLHPLDAQLQLPLRVYSYEIQRRLVKAAVQGPFDEALGVVADTTGVRVPKRSAEQLVLEASADFDGSIPSIRATPCGLPRTFRCDTARYRLDRFPQRSSSTRDSDCPFTNSIA